jgi:carbon-monoxide dehydrogenase medium subunit
VIPAPFEYHRPATLEEADSLLAELGEEAKVLGGGQSLVPLMKLRLARPRHLVDLGAVEGLRAIRDLGDRVVIGALATHAEIEASDLLRTKCPLLPMAASTIGDVQVRNRGTLGGSIAHSDPTGDMPPCVLALDARIKAVSRRGERWIPAERFFVTLFTTDLAPDEILVEVEVPVREGARCAYLKAAQRASGFAVVGVAVSLIPDGADGCRDIAIALTGVTDRAYRAKSAELALRGRKLDAATVSAAVAGIAEGVDVNEDINGSKEYRAHLARVYALRAIQAALRSQEDEPGRTR